MSLKIQGGVAVGWLAENLAGFADDIEACRTLLAEGEPAESLDHRLHYSAWMLKQIANAVAEYGVGDQGRTYKP